MSKNTTVFLLNIEDEVKEAITLIERFKLINNKCFRIKIFYDYLSEDLGYYEYTSNLYINPLQCHLVNDNLKNHIGFIEDYSILSTIIHEFSHFLDFKYNILNKYKNNNFNKIELGDYAKTELIEELAELIVLYIINPYLLNKIDNKRYKFLKSIFKSPSPNSKKRFLILYSKWSKTAKQECKEIFNIVVENNDIIYKY